MKIDAEELALSIIPGPESIPQPYSSINVKDIAEYSPAAIAEAILSMDEVELINKPSPSWWEWRAQWSNGKFTLIIDMTCLGDNDEYWGGSSLYGVCDKASILKIWGSLTDNGFKSVWLHNGDCQMYTREGFSAAFNG